MGFYLSREGSVNSSGVLPSFSPDDSVHFTKVPQSERVEHGLVKLDVVHISTTSSLKYNKPLREFNGKV